MTRVTAPIGKLARSLAANPSVARPTYLASTSSHNANTATWADSERDDNSRHFTTTHRPTPMPVPSRNHVIPLMQTFNYRATAPQAAQMDTSSIDFIFMPALQESAAGAGAAAIPSVRVPLLPDSFALDHAHIEGHAPEATDGVTAARIPIVAANPEVVTSASALVEVESVGVDGVELKFAHTSAGSSSPQQPSMLRDLWKGLVDDLTNPPKSTPA